MDRLNHGLDTVKESIILQENKLKKIESTLNVDYGPDDDFLYLTNQVLTINAEKYRYELTPFKDVKQHGKTSSEVRNMGNFVGWGTEKHSVMKFDGGEVCWGGPPRSTKIMVVCGTEDRIFDVKEPGMCEYTINMETPAACRQDILDKLKTQVKKLSKE